MTRASAARSGARAKALRFALPALLLLGLAFALPALAQDLSLPSITSKPAAGGGQTYTLSVQTLLTLTALSFLPAVLLLMTGFTRIVIVLSLLRHALGLQSTPSNQVVISMSLFLTLFVMSPVLDRIYDEAYLPFAESRIGFTEAVEKGAGPLRTFMLRQTREPDLAMFMELSKTPKPARAEDLPMRVVIPAFAISEMKTGFQMGFFLFIPFVLIDLIVATTLLSMGMMQLPPAMISLPFKLVLFVTVDGWSLVVKSLVRSFA